MTVASRSGEFKMNNQCKEFLDTFEATLRARLMASDAVLMSTLDDDPADILRVYKRHERALDLRVSDMAKQIGKMEGLGPDTESELRNAAVELIKGI